MRRRQVWQQQAEPKPRVEAVIEKPLIKGMCRYCGQKIGRGIAFHEKRCQEKMEGLGLNVGP